MRCLDVCIQMCQKGILYTLYIYIYYICNDISFLRPVADIERITYSVELTNVLRVFLWLRGVWLEYTYGFVIQLNSSKFVRVLFGAKASQISDFRRAAYIGEEGSLTSFGYPRTKGQAIIRNCHNTQITRHIQF